MTWPRTLPQIRGINGTRTAIRRWPRWVRGRRWPALRAEARTIRAGTIWTTTATGMTYPAMEWAGRRRAPARAGTHLAQDTGATIRHTGIRGSQVTRGAGGLITAARGTGSADQAGCGFPATAAGARMATAGMLRRRSGATRQITC